MSSPIYTPLCSLLRIQHPVILAGMAHVATAPLAAAVSNAGGLGVIGALGQSPSRLDEELRTLKSLLTHPDLPFGVDLALPQIGGSARKTNKDYTNGQLDALVDVIASHKTKLFVSAVGIPPKYVVDKLHSVGCLVMNMAGAVRHAEKALDVGVDLICAQGSEAGGHTGPIGGFVLLPAIVDLVKNRKATGITGQPVMVVAAGGIADGRGLAASMAFGAVGVWIGTRFLASHEAGCSDQHKQAVVDCSSEEAVTTVVLTGRPLRAQRNAYLASWEARPGDIADLTGRGIIPIEKDLDDGNDVDMPFILGQVAGRITSIQPAGQIVRSIVTEAAQVLSAASQTVQPQGKL